MIRELFNRCFKVGEYLYCISSVECILMRLDLSIMKFSLLDAPFEKHRRNWDGAVDFVQVGQVLYLPDQFFRSIVKYDISNGSFSCIEWGDEPYRTFYMPNYRKCVLYMDYMYIFPCYDNKLRIFNVSKEEWDSPIFLWSDNYLFPDNEKLYPEAPLVSCVINNRENAWIFPRNIGKIAHVLIGKNVIEYLDFPINIHGCLDAAYFHGKFFILDLNGDLYEWNIGEKYSKNIVSTEEPCWIKIAVTEKNVWFIPGSANNVLIYCWQTRRLEIYKGYPMDFHYVFVFQPQGKFSGYCEDESYYYFAMSASNYMLVINKKTGKEEWKKPQKISSLEINRSYAAHGERIFYEIEDDDIRLLYEANIKKDTCMKNTSSNIGKVIWDTLLR